MMALNNKNRDRALIPGVLAEMKAALKAAGGAEGDDGGMEEQKGYMVGEMEEDDEEAVGEQDGEDVNSAHLAAGSSQAEPEEDPAFDTEAAEAATLLLSLSGRH